MCQFKEFTVASEKAKGITRALKDNRTVLNVSSPQTPVLYSGWELDVKMPCIGEVWEFLINPE